MLKIKKLGLLLAFLLVFLSNILDCYAQNLGLNALFSPGLRLSSELMPFASKDTNNCQISRVNVGYILPFGGKARLKLSELQAGYKQNFFTMNLGVRQVNSEFIAENQTRIGNLSIGLTHVNLRVGKGTLFYTANFGVLRDIQNEEKLNPYGIAAFAYAKILGLRKQNIFGVAVAYSFQRVIPVPIIGFNRKLAEKWDLQLLVPLSAEIIFSPYKKFRVSAETSLGNFRSFLTFSPPNTSNNNNLQYFHVQSLLSFQFHLNSRTRFFVQTGAAYLRKLQLNEERTAHSTLNLTPTTLLNFQLRIDLGKSVISSQLFGNDF